MDMGKRFDPRMMLGAGIALLALGLAVSLLLAVAGVFLLVTSARGAGVWAMFRGPLWRDHVTVDAVVQPVALW